MRYLNPLLPSALLAATAIAAAAAPAARADSLLLTEVVTDPQADHSENAGGNGVPYDTLPGTGTVSPVDEFVEIFHGGSAVLDLAGLVLEFLDTTPSVYVFGSTRSGVLRFSPGSSLHALLPGGYVVLGNPPGSLNNAVAVVLKTPDGTVLDRMDIDDGNAVSPLDEAVVRAWTGRAFLTSTVRAAISPLAPGSPVPEPGPAALVLLSLIAAGAATLRKGRPDRARTSA